jgi:hypothetical protein
MHELGHTWGMQRGEEGQWGYHETYDYDQLTVMHRVYHDIVENGVGIHMADAYCFRKNYSRRTRIKNIVDVGVESYYADNGLHSSTSDSSSYSPGNSITLENITVENNSNSDVSDVRIRIYLSKDRNITPDDYKVGSYWYWENCEKETYNVFNISSNIPDNIPAGTYYIGMIVTVNGYEQDDYTANNKTSFFATIRIRSGGSNGSDGNGKEGKCFIATAAFGSLFNSEVIILRDFRDRYMMNSELGRQLVSHYNKYSPSLAALISQHDGIKSIVRTSLVPVVLICDLLLRFGNFF